MNIENLIELARVQKDSGSSVNQVLSVLSTNGAGLVDCIRVVYELEDMSLREARDVALRSPTWSHLRSVSDMIQAEMYSLDPKTTKTLSEET